MTVFRTRWWHALHGDNDIATPVDAATESWPRRIVRVEGTLSEAEAAEIRQRIVDDPGWPHMQGGLPDHEQTRWEKRRRSIGHRWWNRALGRTR